MKRTEFEKIIAENGLFFSYEGGAGDFVTVRNNLMQDVAIISETSVAHPYWLDISLAGKPDIPEPTYQAIKAYAATKPRDRDTRWLSIKVDADDIEKVSKGWTSSGMRANFDGGTVYHMEFKDNESIKIVEKIVKDLYVQTLRDDEDD